MLEHDGHGLGVAGAEGFRHDHAGVAGVVGDIEMMVAGQAVAGGLAEGRDHKPAKHVRDHGLEIHPVPRHEKMLITAWPDSYFRPVEK